MPWLWHQIAIGEVPVPTEAYESGNRLRWLLGDLDSLYLTLRRKDIAARAKFRAALSFLNFCSAKTRLEVFRVDDARPFLRELKIWLRSLFGPADNE